MYFNFTLLVKDFPLIWKKYFEITTSMVAFENFYLNIWKSTIDEAKNGLKAFLITKNVESNTFEINSDSK